MNNKIRMELLNEICEVIPYEQIFDSLSTDEHEVIWEKDGVTIYAVPNYGYADIIGLTPAEFNTLEEIFNDKVKREQLLAADRAERKRKALINLYYMLHPEEWEG
jgi:hypothetical protein